MKKSTSSSKAKIRGMQTEPTTAEMKAALQLIHLSRDSDDSDNSKVVTVEEEEEESSHVYRMKKRKFPSISSLYQDNDASSGPKVPIRDEEDRHLKSGIPKSIKFRSIIDLYKCTNRLSPVEDECNWSLPAGKGPNINTARPKKIQASEPTKRMQKYRESDGEIVDKNWLCE